MSKISFYCIETMKKGLSRLKSENRNDIIPLMANFIRILNYSKFKSEKITRIRLNAYCNYVVLLLIDNQHKEAFKCCRDILKFAMDRKKNDKYIENMIPLLLLNLGQIYYHQENYSKARRMIMESLYKQEPVVFLKLRDIPQKKLKSEDEFLKQLPVLLNGYLILGVIIRKMKEIDTSEKYPDENKFFENGLKLSNKFFSEENMFSKKFQHNLDLRYRMINKILDSSVNIDSSNNSKSEINDSINRLSQSSRSITTKRDFRIKKNSIKSNQESKLFHSQITSSISKKNLTKKSDPEDRIDTHNSHNSQEFILSMELQKELKGLKDEIKGILDSKKDYQDQKIKLEKELKSLKSSLEAVKAEKNKLTNSNDDILTARMASLELTVSQMKTDYELKLKQKENELISLKEKITQKEVEEQKLREVTRKESISNKTEPENQARDSLKSLVDSLNPEIEKVSSFNIASKLPKSKPNLNSNLQVIESRFNKRTSIMVDSSFSIEYVAGKIVSKKILTENGWALIETLSGSKNEECVSIRALNENKEIIAPTEKLTKDVVKSILNMVQYDETTPYSLTIKGLISFEAFARYYLLPFVNLNVKEKKIEIFPKAQGIIKPIKIKFFDEDGFLFVHHLEDRNFRISYSKSKSPDKFMIEVEFDEMNFNKLFTIHDSNTYEEGIAILNLLENKENSRSLAEARIPLISSNSLQEFTTFITSIIAESEIYLKELNISTFSAYFERKDMKVICVRVWGEFQRFRIHYIKENPLKHDFSVFMKNGYETFATEGKRVRAKGYASITFSTVEKILGVSLNNSSSEAHLPIAILIPNLFTLKCYEKELETDEVYGEEPNVAIKVPIITCTYSRSIFGQKAKYPVTLELLCSNDEPIGIKTTLFSQKNCKNTGVLFIINKEIWRSYSAASLLTSAIKKRKKKYLVDFPVNENYVLTTILDRIGWILLRESLSIIDEGEISRIEGIKKGNNLFTVASLESILNWKTIEQKLKK